MAEEGAPRRARLSPGAAGTGSRWRQLLPQSALGLAGVVFCMGVAAAFTGAVLYAYYEARLTRTNKAVEAFTAQFTDQVEQARALIESEGNAAAQQVKDQLEELQRFAASGETLTSILERAQASVWFVSTFDDAGQPSVGSAFVVFADAEQSYLITSLAAVRAATTDPGPDVVLHKGGEQLAASLFTWDDRYDMALLVVARGNMPSLPWAGSDPAPALGDRVFAVSGLGAAGASVTQGLLSDVSTSGFQHDAAVGAAYRGGPLLDADGEVLGMVSRTYAPLPFDPLAVFFAPPIRAACEQVLTCPAGTGQPG